VPQNNNDANELILGAFIFAYSMWLHYPSVANMYNGQFRSFRSILLM